MNNWPDKTVEKLKLLWADGLSATQIMSKIPHTRSAILGKVNRLGLSRPKKELKHPKRSRGFKKPSFGTIGGIKPLKPEPIIDFTVNEQPCSFLELTSKTCHWPCGNPQSEDFHFCGAKVYSHKYCAGHYKIGYR